jgi:hypothetical protein
MHEAIAEWASRHPRIRRIWASDRTLALELQPVADSEETLAVWMANAGRWQLELTRQLGETIELGWFDPDGATLAPEQARSLVYERGMQ